MTENQVCVATMWMATAVCFHAAWAELASWLLLKDELFCLLSGNLMNSPSISEFSTSTVQSVLSYSSLSSATYAQPWRALKSS